MKPVYVYRVWYRDVIYHRRTYQEFSSSGVNRAQRNTRSIKRTALRFAKETRYHGYRNVHVVYGCYEYKPLALIES